MTTSKRKFRHQIWCAILGTVLALTGVVVFAVEKEYDSMVWAMNAGILFGTVAMLTYDKRQTDLQNERLERQQRENRYQLQITKERLERMNRLAQETVNQNLERLDMVSEMAMLCKEKGFEQEAINILAKYRNSKQQPEQEES